MTSRASLVAEVAPARQHHDGAGSTNRRRRQHEPPPRPVAEQLSRDAGYEPIWAGGLENAAAQEDFLKLMFAINQNGMGPFFYRML